MKKANPYTPIIQPELDIFSVGSVEPNKFLAKQRLKTKPEIIFFGSDSWSISVLQPLEDNFDVVAVVTVPDSPIANYFKGPVLTPDKFDENFISINYQLLTTDLFVVASYGKIIPQLILDIPKYGSLNVHPSLLPKYRGASPIQETILNGDKTAGVTIIKMDEKMDHGPVIITKQISLSGQEDFLTLINILFRAGAELLVDIIPDFIAGKCPLEEQNHGQATFTKLLKKEDGYFDINNPPSLEKLDRMIRAYSTWPGVWTLWEVESAKGKVKRVVKLLPGGKIQMAGKKPLTIKDFLNGYPNFPLKNL